MTTSKARIPNIPDPKSELGVRVTTAVQSKLRRFLGADYEDRSLAQYVVIMLAHKTGQEAVAENLVEFLGEVDSKELASWLFENLHELVKPPPSPTPPPQQQQQQQQQQGQRVRQPEPSASREEAAAAAAADGEHDDALELEMDQDEGSEEGADGSDADTAELAMEDGHGGGGSHMRRLQSAVVREEDRHRDERRGRAERSRSPRRHSPAPRHRRTPSPRRRHSPLPLHRRRSPPPAQPRSGEGYFWEGASGARYSGHDPYPYRTAGPAGGGSDWRADQRSPPRRRRSLSPAAARGHGQGGIHGSWQQAPRSPRAAAYYRQDEGGWGERHGERSIGMGSREGDAHYLDRGCGQADDRLQHWGGEQARGGGGGGGGFRSQHHFQHDLRWEDGEEWRRPTSHQQHQHHYEQSLPRRRSEGEQPRMLAVASHHAEGAHPPGLRQDQGLQHPEAARQQAYDARMGEEEEVVPVRQPSHEQAAGRTVLPWERPSYMDLEAERQRERGLQAIAQQQHEDEALQSQYQQPESLQQQQPQMQSQQLTTGHANRLASTVVADAGTTAAAGTFARAFAQAAAASLGLDRRSVLAVPRAAAGQLQGGPAGGPGGLGAHAATFQVTISPHQQQNQAQGQGQEHGQHQGSHRRQLTAPLLHRPALQSLLRQRVLQMELELVKLKTEQAERQVEQAQAQQHLSTAARLALTIRSVCIKGVHPAASDRVLIAHFGACGYIERITHLRDPLSGRRSGVAYMQFSSTAQAQAALALDGSALLQRTIRVVPSDSPAARVAASRVLRGGHVPPGMVPIPMFAASVSPRMGPGRGRYSTSGRGGRGGGRGRAHGTFKYLRPSVTDELAASGAGGAASAGGAFGADAGAALAAPAILAADSAMTAGLAGAPVAPAGGGGDTDMAD